MASEYDNDAFNAFIDEDYAEAVRLYALSLEALTPDDDDYGHTIHMLGFSEALDGNYDNARKHYDQLLKIAKTPQLRATALHHRGMTERLDGQLQTAQTYFERERALLDAELPDNTMMHAANAYERGYIQHLMGNHDDARTIMQDALKLAEESGDVVAIACAYRGLGEIATATGNHQNARVHFQQAITQFEQAQDKISIKEVEALIKKLP